MYNTIFAQVFGLSKGDKWTDEHCEIKHGVDGRIITVLAVGITGQIRGFNLDDYRPDLIIADDILDDENAGTVEQRKKIESLFFGALINSLAPATDSPHAKAVLLQTPLHQDDVVETCLKDPQWHGRRFGILNEKNESIWPDRWPTATVLAEKKSAIIRGQYALWMREKECRIVPREGKTFDIEKLKYWDAATPLPRTINVISIDPASSEAKTADDNVVMAIGFAGEDVYVWEYKAETGVMPDATANHFFNMVVQYHPIKAAVEIVSFQRVLAWYLEEEMKKRRVFVMIDKIQDKRKKSDRIIQTLVGLVGYGHLYIHASMTKLISQMDDYDPADNSQHDDILDALAQGILSMNPALRESYIDGEYEVLDESEYKQIAFGGCP